MNTSTAPKAQYGYASGSANTIRPTTMTYPDGRVLTYGYGTAGGNNDAASRVESLIDDDGSSTYLADYSYLGLGTFVEVDYTEPDVKYTLVGTAGGNDPDTGDIYRGFDRFGRIKDSYWVNYGASADADRKGDRGRSPYVGRPSRSSQKSRQDTRVRDPKRIQVSCLGSFDELYGYDRVDRLQDMERGRLAALKNSISSLRFAQGWSLDATGNWKTFREDDDGTGWDLDQTRTANKVNEITDIAETLGPSWVTPVYNRAGNMTTIPKPADPTTSFGATYDAWNRLVGISSGGTTVAGYEYDGAKRRIVKKAYTSGTLTETRHAYFTEPSKWQVIEERVDSSSSAERQFVWGPRYIDDLVLRDRDTDANGTLDERLYGMLDANWNVTGLVSTSGTVQERFAYSAYGEPMFLDASFGSRSSSSFAWERLIAGYPWDADVAWYAVRHRVYIVGLGWAQRDPVLYMSGTNLHEYVGDNPSVSVDPSGLGPIQTIRLAIVKALKGKICNQLFSFCMHIGRHRDFGANGCKVCLTLYDTVCLTGNEQLTNKMLNEACKAIYK
ncbi:MAG: hypothetical protein FJ297_02745 [Planctomycetes bacterium]|nr:hypothetical protein [Planctomycetota bacterium]